MTGPGFDPIDFQPNSVGVLVVRVIRLKDIMRALDCTEARAREVVKEIRGEESADGATVFVLPSQLAAWAYRSARARPPRRQGERGPAPLLPSQAALVAEAEVRKYGLAEAAARRGSTTLGEIHSELRKLKSVTIQPGATAITVEQAAARLGCSRSRVFELLKAGKLGRAPGPGRRTLITLSSVDAALVPRTTSRRKQRGVPRPASFEVDDFPI